MSTQARSLFRMLKSNNLARYTMYPITGGPPSTGMTAGVALPHDNNLVAGAWGAWTQILLAAAAPAVEFWYCGYVVIATAAATTDQHSVQIGTGLAATPPTPIHDDVDPAGVDSAAATKPNLGPHLVPYPIYQPASTPISGRSAVNTKAAAANITTAVLLATAL
ncbi:MAG: hypothetical protein PHU23_01085 [Dehalococcoidales bacterium]|nr:hypothetical protein [Dehalococcoidales bacterium]